MKISKLSLMVVVVLALTACQTAPPPVVDTPPPEVVKPVEVKPIPVDGGTLQEALTDAEVQEVEAAIKAAEEADGAIFAPELLDKSKKDLEKDTSEVFNRMSQSTEEISKSVSVLLKATEVRVREKP